MNYLIYPIGYVIGIVISYIIFNIEVKSTSIQYYDKIRETDGERRVNWLYGIVWPVSLPFYLLSKLGWLFRTVWGWIDRAFSAIEDFFIRLFVKLPPEQKDKKPESRLSDN